MANNGQALADVIDRVVDDPALCPRRGRQIVAAVAGVRALVDELRAEVAAAEDVAQAIEWVIAKFPATFGDLTLVKGELDAIRFESNAGDLAELLGQVSLRREQEQEAIRPNTVNIMSMHKAKGLDACVVIVAALDEELMPGPNNRDEERRLLYVSLTRARHALFVTHARRRTGQQAQSGIHTRYPHSRTSFLNASGLTARAGREFAGAFTPDLARLTPLPNPEVEHPEGD